MGRVWFTDFEHISTDFEDLTVVSPRITNAFFAKKVVTAGTEATATTEATGPTVDFEEINEGILGRDVYIIVETENFVPTDQPIVSTERANVRIQLKTGDCNLTGTADETLQITNGTADVDEFIMQVGDTEVLNDIEGNCAYTNLDDFTDKAIFKISFRPHTRATFDTWAEAIHDAGMDVPAIEIEVTPEDSALQVLYGTEGNEQGPPLEIGRFANSEGHRFTLENKNVYEIYHGDNLYNPLQGNYVIYAPMSGGANQNERKRIGVIESFREENQIRTYFSNEAVFIYHSEIDNEYEICMCDLNRVRRRANGRRRNITIGTNFVDSQPAPEGGDADTNYYYSNDNQVRENFHEYNDIRTTGNYGIRAYALADENNPQDLVTIIRMVDNLNFNQDGILISYAFHDTMRRYCNPMCYSAFIGVLAETGYPDVESTGMCFEDATSYPSVTHPNGDSIDTRYLGTTQTRGLDFYPLMSNYDSEREDVFAEAFRNWGFSEIGAGNEDDGRGSAPLADFNHLANNVHFRNSAHNNHLHAGNLPNNVAYILNE